LKKRKGNLIYVEGKERGGVTLLGYSTVASTASLTLLVGKILEAKKQFAAWGEKLSSFLLREGGGDGDPYI
jgi:hypothetical protein